MEGSDIPEDIDFDWRNARWAPLYPPIEIVAEIGRITVAAARVDRQLALVLLAIKYSDNLDDLLKKNSSDLHKILKSKIAELFEGQLLAWATENLDLVRAHIEARHAIAHSIWTPGDRSEFFSADIVAGIRNQEQIDKLLAERARQPIGQHIIQGTAARVRRPCMS